MKSNDEVFNLSEEAITKGLERVSNFETRRKIAKAVGGAGFALVVLFAFSSQFQSEDLVATEAKSTYEVTCKRIQDKQMHTIQFTILGDSANIRELAEKSCGISPQDSDSTENDPNLALSGELKTPNTAKCTDSVEIWIDSRVTETFCLKP